MMHKSGSEVWLLESVGRYPVKPTKMVVPLKPNQIPELQINEFKVQLKSAEIAGISSTLRGQRTQYQSGVYTDHYAGKEQSRFGKRMISNQRNSSVGQLATARDLAVKNAEFNRVGPQTTKQISTDARLNRVASQPIQPTPETLPPIRQSIAEN